jgi:uncharacterized protein (TIGR02001 family)
MLSSIYKLGRYKLKNKIILAAVLSALYSSYAFADEPPEAVMEKPAAEATTAPAETTAATAETAKAAESKEPESPWSLSTTLSFVSDYRARGISQTYLEPTVQGSIDLAHSSGFYAGVWASEVTNDSNAGAHEEIDVYVGYNGEIKAVEGLGYTAGLYGYFYPGANYSKFRALTDVDGTKRHESYDTYEAVVGVSYKWLTAKAWVTLNDYYGQNKKTGWTRSTSGSTYYELSALIPLPFLGLNLTGGIGRTHVPGKVSADPAFISPNSDLDGNLVRERTLDYTDYRIGISKEFDIKELATWTTSLTYIGATNSGSNDYWGKNGYGGSSVIPGNAGKNIGRDGVVLNVGITF